MKITSKNQSLSRVHQELVEKLVSDRTTRLKRVPPAAAQWGLWLALSALVTAGVLAGFHPRPQLWEDLQKPGAGFFALLIFGGSALAAWGAILTSLPGRVLPSWQKALMVLALAGLVLIPCFAFPMTLPDEAYPPGLRLDDDWCLPMVFLIGLFPWAVIGFWLSKNASFSAAWTGAWSGASAFLLTTGALYLCCPCWSVSHLLVSHVLPVGIASFLTAWIGAFWFSRWKK